MQPTAPLFRALRRLALTTKQGPKGFYKGTRSGKMGHLTKHGVFRMEWSRVRRYVAPEMYEGMEEQYRVSNTHKAMNTCVQWILDIKWLRYG
jgi:hypothetical protein